MGLRIAIVGHRGVGKTSFGKRLACASRPFHVVDLDLEIERHAGMPIDQLFSRIGEEEFRILEARLLGRIFEQDWDLAENVCIVLGAGADPAEIPDGWEVVWLRRVSDQMGRIFRDRPRLEKDLGALEEFMSRKAARDPRFRARADEVLWLDEGSEGHDAGFEADWIAGGLRNVDASMTLMPESCFSLDRLSRWWERRKIWGLRFIELRDDLLSPEQMSWATGVIPASSRLLSFRDPSRISTSRAEQEKSGCAFDWPSEWGRCAWGSPSFVSLHRWPISAEATEIQDAIGHLERAGTVVKVALQVTNFRELESWDKWQRANGENRVFLPTSQDGRWSWYRLWRAADMKLNFIREDEGSSADQPPLIAWMKRRAQASRPVFAAVLGDPVIASFSPVFHARFFAENFDTAMHAVKVTQDDVLNGALEVLAGFGLIAAAVTSPCKQAIFEKINHVFGDAQKWGSVNTLKWLEPERQWSAINTDFLAMKMVFTKAFQGNPVDESRVAVWGGGGVLPLIRDILPGAQFYSLRTGQLRGPAETSETLSPEVLIWASGANHQALGRWPDPSWRPRLVIDLNYLENSPAREYVRRTGAAYVSGLEFFESQALAQQDFWKADS